MNRRQYLARTGCLAVAVTAGCLGSRSEDGSERTADDRTGDRALERAVGELNRAALALNEADGLENPDEVEFDADEPVDLIAAALEYLETAEAELDADREPDIEELRTYAGVLEELVKVTDTIADDTLEDDVEAVTAAIEDDGSIEVAIETISERNATFAAAHDRLDEAETELDGLDADRLEKLSIVDLEAIEDGAVTLDNVLSSMLTLGSGYDTMLDGYESLEAGEDEADAENHEQAIDEFETAESSFETAAQTASDGLETAPEGLVSYFETAQCQNNALADAAGHFRASSDAALSGDRLTASEEREQGEAALADAEDCSS